MYTNNINVQNIQSLEGATYTTISQEKIVNFTN